MSQIESMNFNLQGLPSIRNRMKLVPRVSVVVDQSAPFYVGPDFTNMVQSAMREFEPYGQAISLHTGVLQIPLPTQPSDDSTLCLQMTDPAPLTVLGWQIDVDLGESG